MTSEITGITRANEGMQGITWNILGQIYVPKSRSEHSFSWHATFPPGTFVPPHIHPTQDEFIYLLDGRFDLVLEGRDHCVLSHLSASTRGGGNRHAGQSRFRQRVTSTDHFQIVEDITGVSGKPGNRLSCVENATTPDTDNERNFSRSCFFYSLGNVFDRGLIPDLVQGGRRFCQ